MKRVMTLFSIVVVLVLSGARIALADDFVKKFHHEFNVNRQSVFVVDNKYGKVNIQNWDKDQVQVDVVIRVSGSESEAQKVFEKITIDFSAAANYVRAITQLSESIQSSSTFSIDYDVFMPKYLVLNLTNKFGDVTISGLEGKGNLIDVKYGSLYIHSISDNDDKPRTEISLSYSPNSRIGECNWLKADIMYSTLSVEKSNALIINSKYSKLYLGTCNALVGISKYDKYEMESINKCLMEDVGYSDIKISQLGKKLELTLKYGSCRVGAVDAGFEAITINSNYSGVKVHMANVSFQLQANVQYGDIQYSDNNAVSRQKEVTTTKASGAVGADKTTLSKVTIESKYGSVDLR